VIDAIGSLPHATLLLISHYMRVMYIYVLCIRGLGDCPAYILVIDRDIMAYNLLCGCYAYATATTGYGYGVLFMMRAVYLLLTLALCSVGRALVLIQ